MTHRLRRLAVTIAGLALLQGIAWSADELTPEQLEKDQQMAAANLADCEVQHDGRDKVQTM